jgi:hypothetical protein
MAHTPSKTHKSAPNETHENPEELTTETQGHTRVWTHVSTTPYSLSFTSHKPLDTPHKKTLFLHASVPHTPISSFPHRKGPAPPRSLTDTLQPGSSTEEKTTPN